MFGFFFLTNKHGTPHPLVSTGASRERLEATPEVRMWGATITLDKSGFMLGQIKLDLSGGL